MCYIGNKSPEKFDEQLCKLWEGTFNKSGQQELRH